ncbi:MAG TPA: hypothetical protein VFE32_04635 [Puia sp.]|jgi:hypothetical protein|nr:hypothetical protein [Puia sp.]
MSKPRIIALSVIAMALSIIFQSLQAQAQLEDPVKFTFYAGGRYKVYAPDEILAKDVQITIDNNIAGRTPFVYQFKYDKRTGKFADISVATNVMLNAKEIDKFNQQLAARMTIAWDNIEDSAALERLYSQFLGNSNWPSIKDDLKTLIVALEAGGFDRVNCRTDYPNLRNFCDLEDALVNQHAQYSVSVALNTDSSRYDIYISQTDWPHECLRNYWASVFNGSSLSQKKIDRSYKISWKELEAIATRISFFYENMPKDMSLFCRLPDKRNDYLSDYNKFRTDTLNNLLLNNSIVQLISQNTGVYQQNFWFNYGFFSINPLGFTTPDRSYKAFLYQKLAAEKHDSILLRKLDQAGSCCSLNMNGVDSLIRQINSGQKVFSTDTTVVDPVWGINDLSTLRMSTKVVNAFQAPVTLNESHPQLSLQFDAARHYVGDRHNRIYNSVTSTDSVNFVVYNIGTGAQISVPQVSQTTTNTSAFQDVFASLSGVSGLVTATGLLSLNGLNQPATAYVNVPQPMSNVARVTPPDRNSPVSRYMAAHVDGTNRPISFTSRDSEKNILEGYWKTNFPADYNQTYIDFFFANCRKNTKRVAEKYQGQKLIDTLEALFQQFHKFLQVDKNLFDSLTLASTTLKSYQWVGDLATITDRSLPPLQADFGVQTDSTPIFRSQIIPIGVKDSTRAIQASVVEKKVSKKDTIITTYPVNPAIRIGKKVFITISAGMEVTTNTYHQKTASVVSNQLVVSDNAKNVGYEIGLNYYPAGLFQIDNRFMGIGRNHVWNRVFFFAGAGLPNPTKDYYTGAGIDLVPGLKLMTGAHLFLNTHYQIVNNQIADQANSVKFAGPYIAINIDPSALITLFNFFK